MNMLLFSYMKACRKFLMGRIIQR